MKVARLAAVLAPALLACAAPQLPSTGSVLPQAVTPLGRCRVAASQTICLASSGL